MIFNWSKAVRNSLRQFRFSISRQARRRLVNKTNRYDAIAAIEELEDRTLLSIFSVMNTLDSGFGSLRQAILDANANPGADTIKFDIGNQSGGGPATITPLTPLPGLHDSFTTLDGTSQPEYSGTPLIEINGQNLPVGQAGIWITGSNNTVRGLVVNRVNGVGIFLSPGADFSQIDHNYIGTDLSGNIDLGNLFQGVFMNSSFNTLEDNVISGNQANGVWIHGSGGLKEKATSSKETISVPMPLVCSRLRTASLV